MTKGAPQLSKNPLRDLSLNFWDSRPWCRYINGRVAEWLIAPDLDSGARCANTVPRVRIHPLPPSSAGPNNDEHTEAPPICQRYNCLSNCTTTSRGNPLKRAGLRAIFQRTSVRAVALSLLGLPLTPRVNLTSAPTGGGHFGVQPPKWPLACQPFADGLFKDGYGYFRLGNETRAYRIAWIFRHGPSCSGRGFFHGPSDCSLSSP